MLKGVQLLFGFGKFAFGVVDELEDGVVGVVGEDFDEVGGFGEVFVHCGGMGWED